MFKEINDLFKQEDAGFLKLGDARMALLDIEAGFWSIRSQIEALIGTRLTNSVLQQAGANGGASFAASFGTAKGAAEQGQFFESCVQAYQGAGFGRFKVKEAFWLIGRVTVKAQDSFEAWMMRQHRKQAEGPVCAYTAGVLVGFVNVVSDRRDVVCIEHHCQALGDEFCEFELLPVADAGDQPVVVFTPDPTLGRRLNLLEMLFERMPMGISVIDRDYKLVRTNPTWAAFIEAYTPSKAHQVVPGAGIFDLEPGTEETLIPLFERVFTGETIRQDAVRIESGGIASFWDIVLSPLYEEEQVVGILNVSIDATERMQAHETLEKRVIERTRELERRQEIAESMRDIIGMINSDIPLEAFLERAVQLAAQRIDAAACVLHQFDLANETLTQVASFGMEDIFQKQGTRNFDALRPSGGEAYLKATMQRKPTYTNYPPLPERVDEIKRDPSIPDRIKAERIALREKFAGSFSVPIYMQDEVFGGMVFYYTEPQEFNDEQIQLGLTFARQVAVALENARLHQQAQDHQRELQMLLDVAAVANSSLELDETLITTLDLLVDLVGASRAGVILADSSGRKLGPYVLRPERDIPPGDLATMMQACQAVFANAEPLYIEPNEVASLLEPGALLPLQVRDQTLGVLVIIGASRSVFNKGQLHLFKSIADQLGIAVENASLYERAEQAAAAQERNRLARDLHDAVSQTLFSASLIADVLPKLWERNPEAGKQKLDELRMLTRGALSEMRTLLFELRPTSLRDMDLEDLLRHLTNAFTGRTRVQAELVVEGLVDPSPEIKEVYYRVAQEALNNITKHADASRVSVHLEGTDELLQLKIWDDGHGFDPRTVSSEHLGLGIMRERAETIGARLKVSSQPGQDTHIEMIWKEGQE